MDVLSILANSKYHNQQAPRPSKLDFRNSVIKAINFSSTIVMTLLIKTNLYVQKFKLKHS